MFLTRVLNAIKSKYLLVEVESTATGFKREMGRERKAEKLEYIDFDPLIRQLVVFKETKKIKGLEKWFEKEWTNDKTKPLTPWEIRNCRGKITSSD